MVDHSAARDGVDGSKPATIVFIVFLGFVASEQENRYLLIAPTVVESDSRAAVRKVLEGCEVKYEPSDSDL